jgi:hypothetical protein
MGLPLGIFIALVVATVVHSKGRTKKIAPECYNGSMTGLRLERWFEFKLLNICVRYF